MKNKLMLAEDVFNALENGKLITIREGRRDITLGRMLFESVEEKRKKIVDVRMVYYSRLEDVFLSDLKNDGFKDHHDMCNQMKRFYPNINLESEVTVIKFEMSF